MKYKNKKWFTLVELVIVMVILIIISSIWFLSYIEYLAWARDSNRITQLKWIHDLFEIQKTKSILPFPDSKIDVNANWTTIWYQWYAWVNALETIEFTKWWVDPKDKQYFSYYLSWNRKEFQLLAYLEDYDNLLSYDNPIITSANAENVNYSKRYITVVWKRLWIMTDLANSPIHEISDLIIAWEIDLTWTNSWTTYLANLSDWETIETTWYWIHYLILTNSSTIYDAPSACWPGFIPVPWNAEFSQEWFCVAKYEMTYETWSWTPDTTWESSSWNTYSYTWTMYISSKNDFPVTDLTQTEAISACENIWVWYHLITENEWLTLARNIEWVEDNWSNWLVWDGYIFNWNSNDPVNWCTDIGATWRTKAAKTWWNDKNWLSFIRTTCDEKRQLLLSSWEIIWDFAWNVSEHVNKASTTNWTLYNSGQTIISWCSPTTSYAEWTSWCTDLLPSSWNTWDSTNWIWQINYSAWALANVFIRWWKHWDSDNAWIYNLDLQRDATYEHSWLGFRCVKY